MTNWPVKLCTKFGEATLSRFRVIKDFIWAKGYLAIWAKVWAKIIYINVWPIKLCTKFGAASVSCFRVIKDFIWAKGFWPCGLKFWLRSFP